MHAKTVFLFLRLIFFHAIWTKIQSTTYTPPDLKVKGFYFLEILDEMIESTNLTKITKRKYAKSDSPNRTGRIGQKMSVAVETSPI